MIINFQPFAIEDKPILDRFFREHHYEQSECAFGTLFIWQDAFRLAWAVEDDVLFIRAGRYGHEFLLPPFAGENNSFVAGATFTVPFERRFTVGRGADARAVSELLSL